MIALTAVSITCWLCAWLAKPGKPLPGNEVQELVYGRLLGRQQRLLLLALITSAALLLPLLTSLPPMIDRDLQAVRGAHAACAGQLVRDETDSGRDWDAPLTAHCDELGAGGVWIEETRQRQADGRWQVTGTVPVPLATVVKLYGRTP